MEKAESNCLTLFKITLHGSVGLNSDADLIAEQLDVFKAKAGRLIMTESALLYQRRAKGLPQGAKVERYKIAAFFAKDTCELCGAFIVSGELDCPACASVVLVLHISFTV